MGRLHMRERLKPAYQSLYPMQKMSPDQGQTNSTPLFLRINILSQMGRKTLREGEVNAGLAFVSITTVENAFGWENQGAL